MNKRIVITGATGIIGKQLIMLFEKDGYQVTVFTRGPEKITDSYGSSTKFIKWNCESNESWKDSLEGQDIVVNLAGANLASKRWNRNSKQIFYDSRILCTRQLVDAISQCEKKPGLLISASAVGIYGDRKNELLNEESKPGNDFLAKLCYEWESEAKNAESLGIRCVTLRIGLVLSKDGGVLKRSLLPFRLFFGGKLGDGKQYFPWIHIDELVNIIIHIINNDNINGAVNCASPGIVNAKGFSKVLGGILHRPSLIPVPRFLLRMAVGEIANVITSGQNVSVQKLLDSGYNFLYPELPSALRKLLNK